MTMREILFRGKRADNGEWTTGTPFFVKGRCKMIHAVAVHPDFLGEGNVYYSEGYPVIPDTVGQFAGLTDKNGKKIFEGDVVAQNWYDYNEPIDESFGVVVYCESNCSFSVMDANENRIVPLGSCHAYHWEAEVIGNINDNPDMIGGV